MNLQRFTHHGVPDRKGHVDLLAGDVTICLGCGLPLFRDHAFLDDGEDPTNQQPCGRTSHWDARSYLPMPSGLVRARTTARAARSIETISRHAEGPRVTVVSESKASMLVAA